MSIGTKALTQIGFTTIRGKLQHYCRMQLHLLYDSRRLLAACCMQAELLDARSAYVITGGTGGLGLLFAAWLAGGGAQHIALWGRSGRAAADAQLGHLLRGPAQVPVIRIVSAAAHPGLVCILSSDVGSEHFGSLQSRSVQGLNGS